MRWYITITDEMQALGLKGNELLVYAIIYGYSANGQGCYFGGVAYLCQLLNVSPRTVRYTLAALEDRGLIRREEIRQRGVHSVSFFITDLERQNLHVREAKIAPLNNHSLDENNYYNNKINTTRAKRASSSEIIQKFIEAGCSADALRDWKAARKSKPITEAVLQGMQREAAKAGITLADAVRICAENGWQGFRAEYLERRKSSNAQTAAAKQSTFMDDLKRTADKLAAKWGAQQ